MNLITAGIHDNTAWRFLLTAALPIFAPTSNGYEKFFITLLANFLTALADLLLCFLKSIPSPAACIVLSVTIFDWFLSQWTHTPNNTSWPVKVILAPIDPVAGWPRPSTQQEIPLISS